MRPIFLLLLLCLSGPLYCQGLYNTSSIHINNANLYVNGHLHSSGALVNNGTIFVKRDWSSHGAYHGRGAVVLDGYMPQKISHVSRRMATLVVNGPGPKYVKGKLNIEEHLGLVRGIVVVDDSDLLLLEGKASVSGGSPESYVDGSLAMTGNGAKFFPVGKNGTYAPVLFSDVKGHNLQFSVEAFEGAPPITVGGALVRHALYWKRTELRGRFDGSPVTVFNGVGNEQEETVLLAGTSWDEAFDIVALQTEKDGRSATTSVRVNAPIILLGSADPSWHDSDFYLSNALTPTAHFPENQRIILYTSRLMPENFRFQVFDRGGNLIYENRSLEGMSSAGWDGRSLDGRMMMAGSYPFRLSARDNTGASFVRTGLITIIH